MISYILMSLIGTLGFYLWYLSKKINTIKTVGTCKKIIDVTHGCEGIFEYEIDGVYHYNAESSSHIGWLKEGKKYTIYVKKDNHEKFVSKKVLMELLFFVMIFLIFLIFFSVMYLYLYS
jgi:hypothetical protein